MSYMCICFKYSPNIDYMCHMCICVKYSPDIDYMRHMCICVKYSLNIDYVLSHDSHTIYVKYSPNIHDMCQVHPLP